MTDLFSLTREAVEALDLQLVDVERAPAGLLRVTIDSLRGVSIDDCERVSHQLSRVYEVEDIDYRRLEVGSPGVDRPLRDAQDYQRFSGERVELRLREARDGRKVFTGTLLAPALDAPTSAAHGLLWQDDRGQEQRLEFQLDDVDRAKLDPILDFKGKKR